MDTAKRKQVAKAILNYARQKASSDWCPVCHSLDPLGPLSWRRRVQLRSPLGFRLSATMSDYDARGQYGPGRVALLDRTFDELERSALEGCACCDLLSQTCKRLQLTGEEINIWLEQHQNPKITIWVDEKHRAYFELFILKGAEQGWGILHELNHISSHAGSMQSSNFLHNSLFRCLSEHPVCKTIADYMPMRLIEVVHDGNRCRLIDCSGVEPQPYVALSYRWGDSKSKFLSTTRNNMMKSKTYISRDALPKAVRDAVALTHSIGVKYLWVDALCIIQDDPRDWETHVSYMGDIYQHAYLVVAAGSSTHSDDSFLHVPDRPGEHTLPFHYKDRFGQVSFRLLKATGMHALSCEYLC